MFMSNMLSQKTFCGFTDFDFLDNGSSVKRDMASTLFTINDLTKRPKELLERVVCRPLSYHETLAMVVVYLAMVVLFLLFSCAGPFASFFGLVFIKTLNLYLVTYCRDIENKWV